MRMLAYKSLSVHQFGAAFECEMIQFLLDTVREALGPREDGFKDRLLHGYHVA